MLTDFYYDETHRVVVCKPCKTCVVPGRRNQERHLRAQPHRLLGAALKAAVEYLNGLDLKTTEQLKLGWDRAKGVVRAPISHLQVHDGFQCLLGDVFLTTYLPRMQDHMITHGKKPKQHKQTPLWAPCRLQTYFGSKDRIDYFVVTEEGDQAATFTLPPPIINVDGINSAPTAAETEYCNQLEKDYAHVADDLTEQGAIAQGFGDSRSARIPWLERTAFPSHLEGLTDTEIKGSYTLPLPRETETELELEPGSASAAAANDEDDEAGLITILAAVEAVFRDAYKLCSDSSPDRKMTQQRANILNEFYVGASGQAAGFRYYKNASTLVKYFTVGKQLLVYYYRVVHQSDGYFSRTSPDQKLPQDVIQPTAQQTQAMDEVMAAVGRDDKVALKHAIRRLYMALICQTVGSVPFRSAVLSFAAMLSRKGPGKGVGRWEEPGNFNSRLSALTWMAQLILFDYACFQEQDDEDQIPVFLAKICRKFFQQLAETPFGHILQWRLYLFKVGKAEVTKHQAVWALDGQSVVYRGLELQMSHIPQLVASECQQAHALLYDELMFQATDLTPMQSWRLQDDLDFEDYGGSWLSLPANAELVHDAELALFRRIRADAELRATFFTADGSDGGFTLCEKAMDLYEAQAQRFLEFYATPMHIASGQPLREPELLSITVRNTARPRHLWLWQKQVMLYTQYHKGQQQSGVYKDNIRFLPQAMGDPLLDYIAYVLPLRQLFLRQRTPRALLSPYLFAKLDGTVWPDGSLSRCMGKACARATVPRLHVSNWRQISVSICKEKFSAQEQAHFDLEHVDDRENPEAELDLVALAEQSNHSYATFNRAYAGSTTLTMNTLLHRNHRASASWQGLFQFDRLLHGKRPRPGSGPPPAAVGMFDAAKKARFRRRGAYSAAELLTVARQLYNRPDMQFRVPGQRNALLAVLGTQPAEQVVVVLATGSGKTLIPMISASVADAQTTILVLPTVALRGDQLRRYRLIGLRPLTWTAGVVNRSAPLVIVSAEAVCTAGFLDYAHALVRRQALDRIVVDESQLTITASDYRPCMSQLGWYIRQVRTQTVWLTATLPPAMQEEFIEQNKLVRPHVVRESTNRPNIQYLVGSETGAGSLVQKAADLIRSSWPRREIFDHGRDKIIVYCRRRDEAGELGKVLRCPVYTSESGSEEEKGAVIARWLSDPQLPVIAATGALGIGFDYPHVRWAVHVDAPSKMTDFSQESGRAGRDGRTAASIVMLRASWTPNLTGALSADQEAMQLYLTQRHCSRGVLSQFLDDPADWRWCMGGDEACQVCGEPHVAARPPELRFVLRPPAAAPCTGPGEVLRQERVQDQALDRYGRDLEILKGTCLRCRAEGGRFDHAALQCPRRHQWMKAKKEAYQTQKKRGKEWIRRYTACWKCYQPQAICRVADPEHDESECRFPDMVMPLCYGVYARPDRDGWFNRHFRRTFGSEEEYMVWLGETASLGGTACIQANCVAAIAMAEFGG
jgi:hypothetical protein